MKVNIPTFMRHTLKYLGVKGIDVCSLLSNDSKKKYIYTYTYTHIYIL